MTPFSLIGNTKNLKESKKLKICALNECGYIIMSSTLYFFVFELAINCNCFQETLFEII